MKIIIPLAVRSKLFPEDEYPFPTPLIDVAGKPMIEWVIENIEEISDNIDFVFILSQTDVTRYSLDNTLRLLCNNKCEIVVLKKQTQGALCSCLMAISQINADEPLIICNGDQIIPNNIGPALNHFASNDAQAGVITFPAVHPRWSFVKTNTKGHIIQSEEKKVISAEAIAGFYYFAKANIFLQAAQKTIYNDRSINGLFYIAPTLNEVILAHHTVVSYRIQKSEFFSFYTPATIDAFEEYLNQQNILQQLHPNKHLPINILIPAAGKGRRFVEAGYSKPKPFIDVLDKPMIQHVIDNLAIDDRNITLLLQRSHLKDEPSLKKHFENNDINIVTVDKVTEGTACTALLARDLIDNDQPLLIANSDQYVDFNAQDFVDDCLSRNLDGSILVFKDPTLNPKWSFAKYDEGGLVTQVAEKEPISDMATVGIYFFRSGRQFTQAAIDMIVNNDRVNGEFYTCPVYNYMITTGAKIGLYEVPSKAMHGLGTPEDLNGFLASLQDKK